MFEIVRYGTAQKELWNHFVENSKNGTFLFDRNYMDYHADRFTDHSLMIFHKGTPYAILPANIEGDTLWSHKGLTYGGLIAGNKVTAAGCIELFTSMNAHLRQWGIRKVIYKSVPYIYHRHPSQEDLYALFRTTNARIVGRNISSAIAQTDKLRFSELRRRGVKKATAHGLTVRQTNDLSTFWRILSNNLKAKYGVSPVHSLEEICLLQSLFPHNIKLYMTYQGKEALGGTLIYTTHNVVHTQYISASPLGKRLGALDLLFDHLINREYTDIQFFDFGQSTELMGNILNEQLIFQKEGFGGRGVCYDVYEYEL